MSAKVFKGAAVAAVLAVVALMGSTSQALQTGGDGAGMVSVYDATAYHFEVGAVSGQGTNPRVCVTLTSKAFDRRAQGCGPVSMWVHPTLETAMVKGTISGTLTQVSTGRVVSKSVAINLDLNYQGIGMYEPLVTSPRTNLWLYPLNVAASQGAGIARAAWGWGSVKAPVCRASAGASIRNRTQRNAATVCGPTSSAPAFSGTIAETLTTSTGLAM